MVSFINVESFDNPNSYRAALESFISENESLRLQILNLKRENDHLKTELNDKAGLIEDMQLESSHKCSYLKEKYTSLKEKRKNVKIRLQADLIHSHETETHSKNSQLNAAALLNLMMQAKIDIFEASVVSVQDKE